MKKTLLISLVFALAGTFAFSENANTIEVKSKISQVTVYADRAVIERTAELELQPGSYNVIFNELPVTLDENSVRAKGAGPAKITGTQSTYYFVEKPKDERVRALQDKLQGLTDQDKVIADTLETLRQEREFLASIKAQSPDKVSKELIKERPQVNDFKSIAAFLKESLTANSDSTRQTELQRRDLTDKIRVAENELNQIYREPRLQYRKGIVALDVEKAGKITVTITYLIWNANWQPRYDVRILPEEGKVEITYKAFVAQNTGENWDNVNLVLSTAQPSVSGRIPELLAWNLNIYAPPPPPMASAPAAPGMMGMMRAEKSADKMQKGDFERDEMNDMAKSNAVANQAVAQAVERGTAVFFEIEKPENIPSDGSQHKTTIAVETFKTDMVYESNPKLSPYAYLKSTITNNTSYPFLAGPMNIFLGADFIGTSWTKTIASSEKFDAYLGIDENIKIERKQDRKYQETIGGLFSSSKTRKYYGYTITVQNFKKEPVTLQLADQLPVPLTEDITVELVKTTVEPSEKTREGFLKWNFTLKPNEKKEIYFEFAVNAPEGQEVYGLE
ncbi:MAG: mucoidy inhibitor MuiA family protein [Planctomycetes bacterium]|nr:mucoidy inhibitor MuiA family protein [Planctomycetota bacterium]